MQHISVATLATLGVVLAPSLAAAQSVNVTRSILPTLPYTVIYPEGMIASGGGGDPLTINHPDAPLQCDLTVVPVEDTGWTADAALGALDEAEVVAAWSDIMPGFALGTKGTVPYQDATALVYEGSSPESSMGVPLTVVHTETVANGRGYVLDCLYGSEQAKQIRPIVDFIIANFATRSDAECCIGAEVAPDQEAVSTQ